MSLSANDEKRRRWTPEEEKILVEAVEQNKFKKWGKVAQIMGGRSVPACRCKFTQLGMPRPAMQYWKEEEDNILREWANSYSKRQKRKWSQVVKLLPWRTISQCKTRWHYCLRGENKTKYWTLEEEELLVNLFHDKEAHSKLENIQDAFPGRTERSLHSKFYKIIELFLEENPQHRHRKQNKFLNEIKNEEFRDQLLNFIRRTNSQKKTKIQDKKNKSKNQESFTRINNRPIKRFKPDIRSESDNSNQKEQINHNNALFNFEQDALSFDPQRCESFSQNQHNEDILEESVKIKREVDEVEKMPPITLPTPQGLEAYQREALQKNDSHSSSLFCNQFLKDNSIAKIGISNQGEPMSIILYPPTYQNSITPYPYVTPPEQMATNSIYSHPSFIPQGNIRECFKPFAPQMNPFSSVKFGFH